MNIWNALENGTDALPSIWRDRIGDEFDRVTRTLLDARPESSTYFHCRRCGQAHHVASVGSEDMVAVCTCDPENSDELMLTSADHEILELNWTKLARALCRAVG